MNLPRKSLILWTGVFAVAVLFPGTIVAHASATNLYIAQTARGTGNGADCADAYPVSFFNSSGNWGSGSSQIGPGTTVHLCGTISSQLGFQGNGAAGNPITLLFEPGAMMSNTGNAWSSNSPIWLVGNAYVVINGGLANVGGTATNIQATDNGSSMTYHQSVTAIEIDNSHDITIENLGCGPLYVHTSASDDNPGADSGGCVYANALGANVTVHDSTFHDMTDGLLFAVVSSGTVNMNVYNNNFYNIDHDLFTSCGNSSSGFYFHNNLIHDPANWDTSSDTFHHDGWILAYFGGTTCTQVYDYNNKYYGDWGLNNTSPIFWDDNGGNLESAYVFNDVFMNSSASNTWNNGINAMVSDGGGPAHLWNNTVICPSAGGNGLQTEGNNIDLRNNVETGCGSFFDTSNAASASVAQFDYNFYGNWAGTGAGAWGFLNSGTNGSQTLAEQFTAWKGILGALVSGAETHSAIGASAGLNSNGQPQAGSPVIAAGTNLYSICNGQPNPGLGALCSDAVGKGRPASGQWTMGAYSNLAPDAPSGLTGTIGQ